MPQPQHDPATHRGGLVGQPLLPPWKHNTHSSSQQPLACRAVPRRAVTCCSVLVLLLRHDDAGHPGDELWGRLVLLPELLAEAQAVVDLQVGLVQVCHLVPASLEFEPAVACTGTGSQWGRVRQGGVEGVRPTAWVGEGARGSNV